MMKKILVVLLASLVLLTACSSGSGDMAESVGDKGFGSSMDSQGAADEEMGPEEAPYEPNQDGGLAPGATDLKLIKEGSLRLEVEDALETAETIEERVSQMEGYVSSENQRSRYRDGRDYLTINMLVRIPDGSFDSFLEGLTELGQVANKHVSVMDVTQEYIDLDARLSTLKEAEARFVEIFAEADTVEDMLAVETELTRLRQDIESLEGRFRYLTNRIDLSSLEISLEEVQEKSASFEGLSLGESLKKIGASFSRGIYAFLGGLDGLANGVAYWLPTLLLLALLAYGLYRLISRKKKKVKNKAGKAAKTGKATKEDRAEKTDKKDTVGKEDRKE